MILALRTDKPIAELYVCEGQAVITSCQWEAHRQLADTIHIQIEALLRDVGAGWSDITGLIVFKGPGSFTGLRIGITIANTIAFAQNISIVGTMGDRWLQDGLFKLAQGANNHIVNPMYGGQVNITLPKK